MNNTIKKVTFTRHTRKIRNGSIDVSPREAMLEYINKHNIIPSDILYIDDVTVDKLILTFSNI